MTRVGVLGLGNMGGIFARRLVTAGHDVEIYNRTESRALELLGLGAVWAGSPAALGEHCEVVITMVADDHAVESVALGASGLLSRPRVGLAWVDMSTISPACSAELGAQATAAKVAYVRAPVSGGVTLAESGELRILASGAREVVSRLEPLLCLLGRNLYYLGAADEARVMKLALNLLVAHSVIGFAEALTFGSGAGLDWNVMLDVFSDSAVGSPLVKYKSSRLRSRDFHADFSTTLMAKDLDLALQFGHGCDVPLLMTGLSRELLQATIGRGLGDADFSSVVLLYEQLAGRARLGSEN